VHVGGGLVLALLSHGHACVAQRLDVGQLRLTHLLTAGGVHRLDVSLDGTRAREDDMDELLLTPTEAATVLGTGRSKVYELMQAGQLQPVHIGACRRMPRKALTTFLEQLRTAR
jgi:excisionase family DNA binding protein